MTTLVNKTLSNGSPVNCHILKEALWGGVVTKETRTLWAPEGSAWPHFRRRSTVSYGFSLPLPQLLMHVLKLEDQYAAMLVFAGVVLLG